MNNADIRSKINVAFCFRYEEFMKYLALNEYHLLLHKGSWIIIPLTTAPEYYNLSKYSLYKHCWESSGESVQSLVARAVAKSSEEEKI